MRKPDREPRVFLSYAAIDRDVAQEVHDAMTRSGLTVTGSHTLSTGADLSRELRRQLLESDAVVAVSISDRQGAPAVAFEVGAALAADKPLFAIVDATVAHVAPIFAEARVYSISHVDQMIRQIRITASKAIAS
ncbi:MAG: toll/interleukin-1 receptor domain-containing protein [Burkholderiales bacterium]|nr:toll/interleukin-1 receptor domain-containing protein [Phycisphaerae bacterium]